MHNTRKELLSLLKKPNAKSVNVGLEYEIFCYDNKSKERWDYEKHILPFFNSFCAPLIKDPDGFVKGVALKDPNKGSNITVEPGSQIEMTIPPCADLIQLSNQLLSLLELLEGKAKEMDFTHVMLGVEPFKQVKSCVPSPAYQIMFQDISKYGKRGREMMINTCSSQICIDYKNEQDMLKKLKAALSLHPIGICLSANSPYINGNPSANVAQRHLIWSDTDHARYSYLDEAFQEGFNFEAYIDLIAKIPLYGLYTGEKGDKYMPMNGCTLEILEKDLNFPLKTSHWLEQMRKVFHIVRPRNKYIEIRTPDSAPPPFALGLVAFYFGLLITEKSKPLDKLMSQLAQNRMTLTNQILMENKTFDAVTKEGTSIAELSKQLYRIAESTLKARNLGEEQLLTPLSILIDKRKTLAESLDIDSMMTLFSQKKAD